MIMDKAIKQRWLDALRSGKYAQGTGSLMRKINTPVGTTDEYCCLGVLCDILREELNLWWDEGTLVRDDKGNALGQKYEISAGGGGILPPSVYNYCGLEGNDAPNPNVIDTSAGCGKSLAEMNDEHISFTDIAIIIEEQL